MKHLVIPLFLLFAGLAAIAQNLPNIQKVSLRAPANVLVDGKATEWNSQFQAFNRATEIFYTMANDDDNLYLAIQVTEPLIIMKLINGGVTLTVQTTAKKNDHNNASITYPVIQNNGTISFRLKSKREDGNDSTTHTADSIMLAHNKILLQKCKWIKVIGIAGVDALFSVYNQDGIEASALFDNKKVYTLEMGIPLKLLGFSVAKPSKFAYRLSVNGVAAFGQIYHYEPTGNTINDAILEKTFAKFNADNVQSSSTTDFWGEYTLAKK
jgi:hypothetical protein